ncbi:unspecified product [Leishmania tarentolae]|uniref:Unspecified product n=1 Tax=Leishmania tarentolae TaxID=5689 RepID=A0A640KX66_LEITA|nr:unspecified product [Leishmania tarentolae]
MFFPSRRSSSSTGGLSPRYVPSPSYERPSSAPVSGAMPLNHSTSVPILPISSSVGGPHSVEDRLRIVKRSRTRNDDLARTPLSLGMQEAFTIASNPSYPETKPSPSVSAGTAPPCAAYPTFSMARLPKHEQHVMDAMVRDFTEVLFFAKS